MSVLLKIAGAIQRADSSYLFEDYTKQAMAVMRELREAGYAIVPSEATDAMRDAGQQAIAPGRIKPDALVARDLARHAPERRKRRLGLKVHRLFIAC